MFMALCDAHSAFMEGSQPQEAPSAPVATAVPVNQEGDVRRLTREAGIHTAKTISIVQDMMVVDAAAFQALNGLLAHHGAELNPKYAAKLSLDYAEALAAERAMRRMRAEQLR